jgi:hypothetical protein
MNLAAQFTNNQFFCDFSMGGQRLNPAFVSDIEKKSTFKNSRDGDRSDIQ